MSRQLPLSWLESNGWLVLSGSADRLSEIRALALGRCDAGGAIAYVSLADDFGDALIDDMVELGAPTGYLVDLQDQDNNAIHDRLSNAGMIVIEPGQDITVLKRLMTQTVVHGLKEALNGGALVLLEGLAATLAGSWVLSESGDMAAGLQFVGDVLILPDARSLSECTEAQAIFAVQPDAICIAIERGAALALGPNGEIETWGERAVTFSFGSPLREATTSINGYD